ncbi:MAG TPA: UDP-N-acetylmuramate dehydrogenase [Deltaproteobacteria bacterium]|nr:UDP-N-acetylmuramate dehydrogenase [Deltaproteobacteria bacterium]HCP44538.1 UDP-N-acetylmuramate dehydrogenase [Deltaproteobacteria bacterium]
MPRGIPESVRTIHLMGICGTGMGAFAGLLKAAGYEVTGSDSGVYPPMSDQLEAAGIPLMEGYRAENLAAKPDLVVVGNVIRRDNPEAEALRALDLHYASFPETLSTLFLAHRHPVVVTGTHGKTTTCSILAHCLHALGTEPGFLVGGVLENFGRNYRVGNEGAPFVIEGDEYDTAYFDKVPKFVHYRPQSAIMTSVEFDHADIYRDLDHVKTAFRSFVDLLPSDGVLVACVDGEHVRAVCSEARCAVEGYTTRGHAEATWQGEVVEANRDGMEFLVRRHGEEVGRFQACLVGEHNLANLCATVALLSNLGHSPTAIAEALASYRGVKRRQTVFAEPHGVTLIDDFAHHPTAVKATIEATRLRFGASRRLWTVFEPRTNTTRRNVFQEDYGKAFTSTDLLLVAPVHRADSIPDEERFDPSQLVHDVQDGGVDARLTVGVDDIITQLADEARPDDVVLILSNGGFDGIYERLPAALLQGGRS